MNDLLEVSEVSAGYGDLIVVKDVSFGVQRGETTVLFGPNGAGKTTLLRAIAGLGPLASGAVTFDGKDLTTLPPYQRRAAGLAMVQENKRVFKRLTVEQNVDLGLHGIRLSGKERTARRAEAYDRFPILAEKRTQAAGYLSGGQQQMLAIAQAMVSHPTLLMLDEPFSGLAPSIVNEVMDTVRAIAAEGRTLLIVEQAIELALRIADQVLVLDLGRLVHVGRSSDPGIRETVEATYFQAKL